MIDFMPPREVFSDWVESALEETTPQPSPMAVRYLIELLDRRVRAPESGSEVGELAPTLAEALLEARLESGAVRIRRMREIGDRALFVAGFFGESLTRSLVGLSYYREIGQAAYSDISARPLRRSSHRKWNELYQELADRFADFVEALADVGDRARPERATDLLWLCERYLETGREELRQRALSRGCFLPKAALLNRWQ